MSDVTIVVPMVPPATLLPNNRRKGSFWTQAKDTDMLRGCASLVSRQIDPIEPPVHVTYRVEWPSDRYRGKSRMPDTDGLATACKAILDGLVDAGVLEDDNADVVTMVSATQTKKTRAGVTVVTITSAAISPGGEE